MFLKKKLKQFVLSENLKKYEMSLYWFRGRVVKQHGEFSLKFNNEL